MPPGGKSEYPKSLTLASFALVTAIQGERRLDWGAKATTSGYLSNETIYSVSNCDIIGQQVL